MPSADRFDIQPFEFSLVDTPDAELRVLRFEGTEHLSQPFEYTIELASKDDSLGIEDFVGQRAQLIITDSGGSTERYVDGLVSAFEQAESSTRFTTYRARIVPKAKLLAFRQDCRIFQEMDVTQILADVLEQAGFSSSDYRLELSGQYSPRLYCVQYRESDLNFITRLLEDEGIFYFFEHTDSGHTMVFGDKPAAHPALPIEDTISHHDTGGGQADGEFIYGVAWRENLTTSAVTLRDFDFKKPTLDHMHLDKKAEQKIELAHYDYPGLYEEPGLGDTRVCTRLDAFQTGRREISGMASVRRLTAGYRFSMRDHDNDRFNREYAIVSVSLAGASPQALEQDAGGDGPMFSASFSAIPSDVCYRPAQLARRPRIDGVQTATIVGPQGEEIYTDEFGRVKVQFHWDRLGEYNEQSSCWVRVSQLWAGAGWGGMDIPRIGQEVITSFEEGDPDRPIVTGRVYNGTNRPPYELPGDKVKSTIKSNSTPGGGGFNELRFDDTKDEEEVFLHSQKNTTIATGNDKSQTTGNDETLSIGHDRKKTVENDETNTINHDRKTTVENNETVTVNNARSETIKNDDTKKVTSGTCKVTVDAGNNEMWTSTGEQKIHAKAKVWVDSTEVIELVSGASSITLRKDGTITINCKTLNVLTDSETTIAAGNSCSISANNFSATGNQEASMGTGTQVVKTNTAKLEHSAAAITTSAIGTHEITGAIVKIN